MRSTLCIDSNAITKVAPQSRRLNSQTRWTVQPGTNVPSKARERRRTDTIHRTQQTR